jgi:hypothetical protein
MERQYLPSPAEVAAGARQVRQRWSPETRQWRRWLGRVRQHQLLGLFFQGPAAVSAWDTLFQVPQLEFTARTGGAKARASRRK